MNKCSYNLLLVLLVPVLLTGCPKSAPKDTAAASSAVSKDFYKGPMRLQLELSSDKINLSDLLTMKLTAQIDPGYEVIFPTVADSNDFKVDASDPATKELADNGKMNFRQTFELEPLRPGTCQIPALTVAFKQSDTSGELLTEPLTIEVVSSVSPGTDIADIDDVIDVPPSRWPLYAAGIAAVLVVFAAVIYVRRPKKAVAIKRIYRPAHELALEMLRALAAENLIEQGRVKEYYHKLSDCLRQYIENRFALRAPEQTTEEFLANLGSSSALEPDHKTQLRQFLQHCDLVKFARYEPTPDQIRQSMTMAESFIENTKSPEPTVDVTESHSREVA